MNSKGVETGKSEGVEAAKEGLDVFVARSVKVEHADLDVVVVHEGY